MRLRQSLELFYWFTGSAGAFRRPALCRTVTERITFMLDAFAHGLEVADLVRVGSLPAA